MRLKEWWSRQQHLTDAQAARWESVRRRGRRRFILVEGVLIWGVSGGVLTAIVTHLLGSPGPLWGGLAINLVLFPLGGIGFGKKMWTHGERRYAAWRRHHPDGVRGSINP
jgi:hypothetical protein